ncbi:MAG: RdgB/HAM1 family non-canonical purine NTP pyrophosphatase [Dokdonella sp.]
MKRIVLASSNRGKLSEMREILAGSGIELIAQSDLGIDDAEETATTFVENALLKARHAARASGLPALGDDSGLCVDALGGAPGLYSARYAGAHGDTAANIAKLLAALAEVEDARRDAHFHCSIALLRAPDDPAPLIVEGRWPGRILREERGSNGFGYNPIFFDPTFGQTAAEMDVATKNRVSHRGLALRALQAALAPATPR